VCVCVYARARTRRDNGNGNGSVLFLIFVWRPTIFLRSRLAPLRSRALDSPTTPVGNSLRLIGLLCRIVPRVVAAADVFQIGEI